MWREIAMLLWLATVALGVLATQGAAWLGMPLFDANRLIPLYAVMMGVVLGRLLLPRRIAGDAAPEGDGTDGR